MKRPLELQDDWCRPYIPSVPLPHSVLFIILSGKAWPLFIIHTPTDIAMHCESGPSDSNACSYDFWRKLLISNFRRFVSVASFLSGVPPASEFYVPTFRNKIQTTGNHLTTKNTTYERNGSDYSVGGDWRGKGGHREPTLVTGKVKVKVTLEQATKAQRGSRGITLLFP